MISKTPRTPCLKPRLSSLARTRMQGWRCCSKQAIDDIAIILVQFGWLSNPRSIFRSCPLIDPRTLDLRQEQSNTIADQRSLELHETFSSGDVGWMSGLRASWSSEHSVAIIPTGLRVSRSCSLCQPPSLQGDPSDPSDALWD